MTYLKLSFALFVLIGTLGCATTHPGIQGENVSRTKDIPLIISGRVIGETDNSVYQYVEVTMENPTEDWVRIQKARLVLDKVADKVGVIVGEDLRAWTEAMRFKKSKEAHNAALAQAGLVALGAAVATTSNNSQTATAGALTALVGTGWALSDGLSTEYNQAVGVNAVPDTHLYAPTNVPAQLFTRRWVLLKKPTNEVVNTIAVEFETVEGQKEIYKINLFQ